VLETGKIKLELKMALFSRSQLSLGAPDSVRCANGSETPTVGFAKEGKKSAPDSVRWCTELSGAPGDRRQELPSWNALNGS
jgi:hypothetical protein